MGPTKMERGRASQRAFLLLDTCGERASVAIAQADGVVLAGELLGPREASAKLVEAIRSVLVAGDLRLNELDGIGVVSGPGSFTGVRVGLAMAKGLCEAAQLPMAAVSRLEVLAEAAPLGAVCVLGAGRGQIYVRIVQEGAISERLMGDEELGEPHDGALVLVDSPELAARLGMGQPVELTAELALGPVLRRFAEGGSDIGLADANYVRDEDAIYRKAALPKALAD